MRRTHITLASLALCLLSACSAETVKAQEAPVFDNDVPVAAVNYQLETVAEGLDHPWSLAFLPSGDVLVTERAGSLRIIRDGALLAESVAGVPAVYVKSQAGLFDVVLHPDFVDNSLIYLTYASGSADANATRLARAKFIATQTGGQLEDFQVLFTVTPTKSTATHYGARLAFMPDGTLLLATGEGYAYREEAQKLDNHFGKTIRLNDDGSVPEDNPFIGKANARPEIWSYGHRNPQGLVIADDGTVYMSEHGPRGGDELNIIEKGKNYGWPIITYGVDYSGALISPFKTRKGMEQPLFYWTPSIAASGLAIYTGEGFPDWKGDIFSGGLALKQIRHIKVNGPREMGAQEKLFTELGSRIRDVRMGPDGFLYFTTDEAMGRVIRVHPQ